ncbi:hypothetical protein NX059_010631 [Plenodomus lindquistii]|nr:hypothetical protein NX059_010631 [Plenodomus lindquistii]
MSSPGSTCSSDSDPQLMGVMPFNCGSCDSSDAPQYELACHDSEELYCRNCLTRTWHGTDDELVRCPHLRCREVCGFMPLHPLGQTLHLDNHFYDIERIDKIRNQPEVMNNLIGFTRDEAAITLQHVYSMFEDQIMDPISLGGIPGYITAGAVGSFDANVSFNPFYMNLLNEMSTVPKMIATPLELEEDLNVMLMRLLYSNAIQLYQSALAMRGIALDDEKAVVDAAIDNYNPVRELKDNWTEIIRKWIDLLTWRHLERLAPPEGGAAERYNNY